MSRFLTVGAAQMGPIQSSQTRRDVVERLIAHLREARRMGCDLVVFPELTLTTFFPRWWMTDQAEIDSFFEREMPGNETAPLFNEAQAARASASTSAMPSLRTRTGGPALQHLDPRRARRQHRRQIPQDPSAGPCRARAGAALPASREALFRGRQSRLSGLCSAFGGIMGMCICNDRRWPETYRVMGLQGVEMVLLGYNTPIHNAAGARARRALRGSTTSSRCRPAPTRTAPGWWASPRAASRRACPRSPTVMIVAPSGKVVARAAGDGDELMVHRCDLDAGKSYKTHDLQLRRPPPAGPVPHDRRTQGRGRSFLRTWRWPQLAGGRTVAEIPVAVLWRSAEQRHVGMGRYERIAHPVAPECDGGAAGAIELVAIGMEAVRLPHAHADRRSAGRPRRLPRPWRGRSGNCGWCPRRCATASVRPGRGRA